MAVHEITIHRSIEDVFSVLTDVTKTGRWYPARVEEWWITPPPHGVGSVRRARVKVMGRASENDAVVTEYDPPRRAALEGKSASVPFKATMDFSPVSGGTIVAVETTFELRGLIRLIGPLFIGPYERGWDKGLQNLKQMMEAGDL